MAARFLFDTNILIYLQEKRSPRVQKRVSLLDPGDAVMSVITLGELYCGLRKSLRQQETVAALLALTRIVPVMSLPENAAESYGDARSRLEVAGQLIGNNDLWIAAHALAAGLVLVTNNEKQFRRIRGLKIENWAKN